MSGDDRAAISIDDLPVLDSFGPEYQADPHGMNRAALAQGPLARGPVGIEVLSYPAVQTLLRDRRFLSPSGLTLALQGITSGPLWDRVVTGILSIDGDEHARLRRFVAQSFTPRSAERLRAAMPVVLKDLLEQAGDGDLDIVDVVRSYPIAIICELLGTPASDWPLFSAWADDIFKIFLFNVAEDAPVILAAMEHLDDYIDGMVEERRANPRDDLMTELVHAEDEGERLTRADLRMLASSVLAAGTDTTRNQLAAAVELLSAYPDVWDELATDPSVAPKVVDEVMRHTPVIMGTGRQPAEDVELCGVTIPAGTFVSVNTAAANRDPSVFPDPDRFDPKRENAVPHLTFGGGIHYCLGVHLAKVELAEALVGMAQCWKTVDITGPVPWKPVVGISGPSTLPVHVTRR
jgi:cytochrome P450